jgi:hypothetical protein
MSGYFANFIKDMIIKLHLKLVFVFCLVLAACASPRVTLVWKTEHVAPPSYNKILVAGITSNNNDSMRLQLEEQVVAQLQALGLNAVSSWKQFGVGGLRELGEEATYVALCDSGIDAVLTFALVEPSLGPTLAKGSIKKYTSTYYYNRIWNYHKLSGSGATIPPAEYLWESILFDLNSLEPRSVLQAKAPEDKADIGMMTEQVIGKMVKEKVIRKQRRTESLKAF